MPSAQEILESVKADNRHNLTEVETKRFLAAYDIPVPPSGLAEDERQAESISERIGFPVVMKIVSPQIMHKTDVSGVELGIESPDQARTAFARISVQAQKAEPDAEIMGVLVEKMMPPGVEVAVGCTTDPQFGQVVMFGLGGIHVELLEDVTFRIPPLTSIDVKEMFTEIEGRALLEGFRDAEPRDKEALKLILLSVSELLEDNPIVDQLDLNPVISYTEGAVVVDAKMTLGR